jgi:ABC-type proline/glycine betaine transport system permease subunit
MTAAGGVLVAVLALLVEIGLATLQRAVTPGPCHARALPGIDATLAPPPA